MIDFHTHILPGIDDGSQDMEETEELFRQEGEQGVKRIVATPHFYADRMSAGRFLEKRKESLSKVRELAKNLEYVQDIRVSAEVYYFPNMGNADVLPRLCMEEGNLLLLELPFVQWTKGMYRDIENILERRKLKVMLAHVERYYEFQKDKSIWNAVFELPVYAQINAGSFLRRGKRSFALKFIKAGHQVLLGSDCHNPRLRPANLKAGRDVISRKLGEKVLEEIDTRGNLLWEGV